MRRLDPGCFAPVMASGIVSVGRQAARPVQLAHFRHVVVADSTESLAQHRLPHPGRGHLRAGAAALHRKELRHDAQAPR